MDHEAAGWLRKLERPLGWLAIPNIAVIVVTLQALGFLLVLADPIWSIRLALVPEGVMRGEWWRLVTFLSLPLSTSPIVVVLALLFLYSILNSIEQQWGAFRTTFYVLISYVLTIAFSFAFDYPITQISHFESTLFLAAAALFPEMEVRLYLLIPVKMKWLAWVSVILLVGPGLISGGWVDRLYLLTMYANFLIFFGPAFLYRLRMRARREKFRRGLR